MPVPETRVGTTADAPPTLTCVYTTLGWRPDGTPIFVAYATCGRCGRHVTNCTCVGGFIEPPYITAKRDQEAEAVRGALPTDVSSTQAAPAPAPTPAPATAPTQGTARLPHCRECDKPVTDDDADRNDDGTWTCFSCQEAS